MASVSKRQQARNEKELQELIQSVPGNNQCADCGARNPGWASWSLGIFLCMRCASIHRKLGTHISKVKSLSMDTWSTDQVESMKKSGNVNANKVYNPTNKKPDIPLDADEVDSAMERFIRKKYQEKSLSNGKPLPPARNIDAGRSRSPENSPPPPLPPKKGKFFGFGLRASSSAYPLSKHDKKNLPREPRVDSAFRISSENYDTASRRAGQRQEVSEEEIQNRLVTLRDMGFSDDRRNATILRGLEGNLERTIESLVRIQQTTKSERVTPASTGRTTNTPATSAFPPSTENYTPQPSSASTNPFDQQSVGQDFGLSFNSAPQAQQATSFAATPDQRVVSSNNPFNVQPGTQTDKGLDQAFQNMQLSQHLFPHSTGGYPSQPPPRHDQRLQHSMTPPVPLIPHHYGYMASPSAMISTNPFFEPTQGSPVVASNPYASMMQSPQPLPPSSNPFFNQQQQQQQPPQSSFNPNPFGIPPPQTESPPQPRGPHQSQSLYGQGAQSFNPNSTFQNFYGQQVEPQQQALALPRQQQYEQQQLQQLQHQELQQQQLQQQQQQLQQLQVQQLQHQQQPQYPDLLYGQPQYQQAQPQFQAQQQNPYAQQGQFQPLQLQQTGRIDKSSILALYNYPQLAPQPLASIPEPMESQRSQQQPSYQPISVAPSSSDDIFSGMPSHQTQPAKRSATMPFSASSMHSAGGGGSRNPFLNMGNVPSGSSTPMTGYAGGPGIGARHASAESVSVNNAMLEGGRHSPDAFASLSARYVR